MENDICKCRTCTIIAFLKDRRLAKQLKHMSPDGLKNWQKDLVGHLLPTHRKVIWIVGKKGGEGKKFIQRHIHKVLGGDRCLEGLSVTTSALDMMILLTRRKYKDVNYFLFDIPRALPPCMVNYYLLTAIKDCVSVKSPNVVAVFASFYPDTKQIDSERLNILEIKNGELIAK